MDETLSLLERGRLEVPADVPLEESVAAGGRVTPLTVRPKTVTARELFDYYSTSCFNRMLPNSGSTRCMARSANRRANFFSM